MPNTPDTAQTHNLVESKFRHVLYPRFVLIALVIILALVGISSRDGRSSKALATDSTTGKYAIATPQASPSYLDYTAWPQAFQIQFSANYLTKGTHAPQRTISLPGNQLLYQAAENDVKFKSVFPRCINLPGVPLRFFARPCEFYMRRHPKHNNRYAAYVYSPDLKESFLLALNLGPPAQDFVARYNQILTKPPLAAPLARTPLPVRGPAGGEPVQWFLTSGTNSQPALPRFQGYYAAMATPISVAGNQYKPPYSFTGAAPGVHSRLVYGQLVYEPLTFVINPNFTPDTFIPPSDYSAIKPVCWPVGQLNCASCHLSDPPYKHIFFTQKGRTKARCLKTESEE